MKMTQKIFRWTALLLAVFALISAGLFKQEKPAPWPVPEEYRTIKNPVPADQVSLKTGGDLYRKNCSLCHGKIGLGDGVKARILKTFSGDFSGPDYQNQTDGEHFYKTKFGREEMPAYEGKIPDEGIWHIVNYMRTFKK